MVCVQVLFSYKSFLLDTFHSNKDKLPDYLRAIIVGLALSQYNTASSYDMYIRIRCNIISAACSVVADNADCSRP